MQLNLLFTRGKNNKERAFLTLIQLKKTKKTRFKRQERAHYTARFNPLASGKKGKTTMNAICFISKDPRGLATALGEYSEQYAGETLVVVDTLATHSKNVRAVESAKAKKKIHLSQESIAKKASGQSFNGYGGARNAALLAAAATSQDCIFYDDDTSPSNDSTALFKKYFSKGKKIIAGKYIGQTDHQAETLYLELCAVLREYDIGLLPKDVASVQVRNILKGLGRKSIKINPKQRLAGGCAGVNAETAGEYCFMPSDYHIEVGAYETLAEYYIRDSVFNDFGSEEPPIVFHSHSERKPVPLAELLKKEARGNIIVMCIKELLDEGRQVLQQGEADEVIAEKAMEYMEKISEAYSRDKNEETDVLGAAGELGAEKDFNDIYELTSKDIRPGAKETMDAVKTYFEAQDSWRKIVAKARKEKWF